ncbi:MAG TPA: hypothetical protein PLO33_09715 [Kouleothrix sp.]|uniref:hypothetical protein n=1 Tax=Kouleothrix sp. TaxID=2779161 RepID=UPI002BD91C8C|nr:hypothetical protein [Kouleothrix sp.]HRC75945.1 hypothetical protein [Kouleothrix sp.]
MQLVATRPQQQVLTLRRHPLVLVPRLALLIGALVLVGAISTRQHSLGLFMLGTVLLGGAIAAHVTSWWMYTITIRYDRVKVRRLRLLFVRHTTYALPGLRGLTYEQQMFGKLSNTGTLILTLPDRTLRFTMITPYSALDSMLGW